MTAQVTWSGRVSVYEVRISLNQHYYHYCGGNKHFQHDYHDDADCGGSSIETNPYSNKERSKAPQSVKLQFDPFEFGFFSLWIPLIVQDWQSSKMPSIELIAPLPVDQPLFYLTFVILTIQIRRM